MICPDEECITAAVAALEVCGQDNEKLMHVAAWLRDYARKREERNTARLWGCTVKYVRRLRKEQTNGA